MPSERLYRIVMTADSRVRIAEKTDTGPSSWRLETPGDVPLLIVGDNIADDGGWPRHLGLILIAEATAEDIAVAMDAAKDHAEVVATFLSVAANARIGPVHVQLAYEITPGADERQWRRIYWETLIPDNKRPAGRDAFGALWNYALNEPRPPVKQAERVMLSMSRYRLALDENDDLARFLQLWMAVEAIAPRVADHLGIDNDRGWQSLRQLAVREGLDGQSDPDLISKALKARKQLFHVLPGDITPLRAAVAEVMEPLEQLVFAAWRCFVPLPVEIGPAIADDPTYVVIAGTLHNEDEARWSADTHPDVAIAEVLERAEPKEPGMLTLTVRQDVQIQNAEPGNFTVDRFELRGAPS